MKFAKTPLIKPHVGLNFHRRKIIKKKGKKKKKVNDFTYLFAEERQTFKAFDIELLLKGVVNETIQKHFWGTGFFIAVDRNFKTVFMSLR